MGGRRPLPALQVVLQAPPRLGRARTPAAAPARAVADARTADDYYSQNDPSKAGAQPEKAAAAPRRKPNWSRTARRALRASSRTCCCRCWPNSLSPDVPTASTAVGSGGENNPPRPAHAAHTNCARRRSVAAVRFLQGHPRPTAGLQIVVSTPAGLYNWVRAGSATTIPRAD